MWPFRRRISLNASGLFDGFVDWHSHILPGVDDGVQTLDEALAILSLYERHGVAEVWLTPHVMEDIPNTTAGLRARFDELVAAYGGSIRLHLWSENMLDNLFEERLAADDLLTADENRVLVETSYFNPPMGLYDTLQRLCSKGYTPVLAHPERYMYMGHDDYRRLKEEGVELQLNVPSLAGMYGNHVRNKAEWLKRNGFYDCMGTDVHNIHMAERFFE